MHTSNSGVNKFKNFFKSHYKFIFLALGLSLLNIFFLCWSFKSNSLSFGKTFIFMLIGTIILEITLCVIIFFAKQKNWKIEKIFLVLGLIIGVFYVFALPIGRAPDESSHFFRIYEITTGKIVSDTAEDGTSHGSMQSSNINIVEDFKTNNVKYHDIINALSIYPNNDDQTFIVTSASTYHPIEYTPHLIGMGLGEALHLPILVSAYLAKLFNCIVCILFLYFSIKYVPFLKTLIFFIALLPITMQGMTSLSADGFITVTAIAFISFVLYATYTMKNSFTKKHLAIILALCLVLSLSKIVYAAICFLLFAIPKERFRGKKQKLLTIFGIGGICFIALLIWIIISSSANSAVDPTNKNLLLSNPFMYISILLRSFSNNFSIYLSGTLGGYLEWFNIVLSPLYLFPSLIIFILLTKKACEKYHVSKSLRYLSAGIFVIITLALFTIMFTQWTKPNETIIDGVQGRYFLPILLLIPLALIPIKKSSKAISTVTNNFSQNYLLYGFLVFESVYAITTIACSHL